MSGEAFTPGPTPGTVCGHRRTGPDRPRGLGPAAAGGRRAHPPGQGRRGPLGRGRTQGRKVFSRGVWAPAATIERLRAELDSERSTEGYARRKEADARRRDEAQARYVEDFHGAVLAFLGFHPDHADLADRLARAVTEHATPVGSGTVARTSRIPVERRAEAAVIAWMRHQTTGYDGMAIPRVKGKRREVRRMLAGRSQELLGRYRRGEPVGEGCPWRRPWRARHEVPPDGPAHRCWTRRLRSGTIGPQQLIVPAHIRRGSARREHDRHSALEPGEDIMTNPDTPLDRRRFLGTGVGLVSFLAAGGIVHTPTSGVAMTNVVEAA